MLVSATSDLPTTKAWKCAVIDFFSRKHTHVVRSTFAAELHALIDAVGQGILVNLVTTELFKEVPKVQDLATLQESGQLWPNLEAFIDAKAVLDAIAAEPIKMPTEKNLYIHLLAMKDLIQKRILKRLTWIDTLDMLSDGMTKGSIEREPLIHLTNKCEWKLNGQQPVSTPEKME